MSLYIDNPYPFDEDDYYTICPDCGGVGYMIDLPKQPLCLRCGGTGRVHLDELTEPERAAWADLMEEESRYDGPVDHRDDYSDEVDLDFEQD